MEGDMDGVSFDRLLAFQCSQSPGTSKEHVSVETTEMLIVFSLDKSASVLSAKALMKPETSMEFSYILLQNMLLTAEVQEKYCENGLELVIKIHDLESKNDPDKQNLTTLGREWGRGRCCW